MLLKSLLTLYSFEINVSFENIKFKNLAQINSMFPINYKVLIVLGLFLLCAKHSRGQHQSENKSGLCVIENIKALESNKDPKCHATASRLEDFMYGTPLTEEARIRKFDLQKKLILYIWNHASKISRDLTDTIDSEVLKSFQNEVCHFGRNSDGVWYVKNGSENYYIDANDLRQYSSVAYALRAMLSVEQDFLFNPNWKLMPLKSEAIDGIKLMVDLITLATLQQADKTARADGKLTITPEAFEQAWTKVFNNDSDRIYISKSYPSTEASNTQQANYLTIKSIINQKIESYTAYNNISLPIFLRNIQVYFARHKWPTETAASDQLKNYLIESMIYFCKEMILNADQLAQRENENFIRARNMNDVIPRYLPFDVNQFEDIIYFPELEEKIMIESYDLDAFRDSGIHWLILNYAIESFDSGSIREPDPLAAELIVETVAQMAVLVLRLTGDISISSGHPKIQIDDMENAFKYIQELINKHSALDLQQDNSDNTSISSDASSISADKVFFDKTSDVGIDYYHKSSDWLSRLIRSYVVKKDENLIRMAIPPAFGGSGVAAEDLNNDDWQDIIIAGGMGVKVYVNNKKGQFDEITEQSGINTWNDELNSYDEIRQVIVSDFDNDGWQDVFLSVVNGQHRIYKNLNGTKFKDMSEVANLGGPGHVGGPATAFDYNNDGRIDLYVSYFGNYINGELPTLSRTNQNGEPNMLFENKGDFSFSSKTHTAQDDTDTGWTQAVGHCDINQDGWQDIIVGNDFGTNAYYINQGNGYFKNLNKQLNTDKPSYTMNVGITDLNRDRYPDFYISNIVVMEKDEKYVNPSGSTKMNFQLEKMENIRTVEANDLFISRHTNGELSYEKSDKVGRGYSSTGWSWDADFFDFDNDGDEDLYCLNGMNDFRVYGSENPTYNSPDGEKDNVLYAQSNREKNNFFVNENGMLVDKAPVIGGDLLSNSRSATYLDYDRDGDLDILINNYHDKAVFLENKIDNKNNWIAIKLKGSAEQDVPLDAIGSSIVVTTNDNAIDQWKEVKSTTGYLSVHPKMQYFGLKNHDKVNITVRWNNGNTQTFENIKVNKEYLIEYDQKITVVKK